MLDPVQYLIALIASMVREFWRTVREAQKTWAVTLRLLAIIATTIALLTVALLLVLPIFV